VPSNALTARVRSGEVGVKLDLNDTKVIAVEVQRAVESESGGAHGAVKTALNLGTIVHKIRLPSGGRKARPPVYPQEIRLRCKHCVRDASTDVYTRVMALWCQSRTRSSTCNPMHHRKGSSDIWLYLLGAETEVYIVIYCEAL
jgi:hypothetical protein